MSAAGSLWTIGHWTCPQDVFLEPLLSEEIELVVDVRALPGSRRSPQFAGDAMPGWLGEAGIAYRHLPALAGRRRRQDVDPAVNAGWRNTSFHNYADYTLTPAYAEGRATLTELATARPTVVLCGEPMPWRCHRLLIASDLTARGWAVTHLMVGAAPRRHLLGQWGAAPVVADDGTVTYPADASAEAAGAGD